MKFVELVGNEKIKEQLTFLYESKRLPHAVVIEGDEGLGKHTLAKEIALNLMCRGEDKPCLSCSQCSKVMKSIHPDVYEYRAPGTPNSFHIETVRDVIDKCYYKPNEADIKIFILANCQCMSVPAQNALLKVLEEPPGNIMFILTTTSKSALLETILSRSVILTVDPVNEKTGAEYICSKDDSISYEDALNACTVWGGNIGKSMQSLIDSKFLKVVNVSNEVCSTLCSNDEYLLLKACGAFASNRELLLSSLTFLKTVFRDALVFSSTSDVVSGQTDTVKNLSENLNKKKLLNLINACDNLIAHTNRNGNNAILITKICYDFKRAIGK